MQATRIQTCEAGNRKQIREKMQADRMNRGGGPDMEGSKMKAKNGQVKSRTPRCRRRASNAKNPKPYDLELFLRSTQGAL